MCGRNAPGADNRRKQVQVSQLLFGYICGKPATTTWAEKHEEGHKRYPVYSLVLSENNLSSLKTLKCRDTSITLCPDSLGHFQLANKLPHYDLCLDDKSTNLDVSH